MYIYSIIFMTNKSVMTFLYFNKYLSIYLIVQKLSGDFWNLKSEVWIPVWCFVNYLSSQMHNYIYHDDFY